MALQIRITSPDGSDPVVFDHAENITYHETLLSPDEGISFEVAKNNPKSSIINPDSQGYAKFWEVWDTETNKRLNYGPISSISDNPITWKITGSGRTQLLADLRSSVKTFYARIDKFVDNLRFENIAIEPRTTTLVHSLTDDDTDEANVFGNTEAGDELLSVSKYSKDFVIDDTTGEIPFDKIEPSRSFFTTKSFWAGTGVNDALIVDLGQKYDISRIRLLFPWWGGKERRSNRAYEYTLAYATDDEGTPVEVQERMFGPFHTIYDTAWEGEPNRLSTRPKYPYEFWIGTTNSGIGYGPNNFYIGIPDYTSSINMRYLRVNISQVRAWYGSDRDDNYSHDGWAYQCDPGYVKGQDNYFDDKKGVVAGVKNDYFEKHRPASDCFASIAEIGALKEILPRGDINPLVLQKIDNNNLQITYSRTPDATETKTTKGGRFRKFEPGTFFRNFTVTWDNCYAEFHKFYTSDCSNCYPDGFHFAIQDHNNNMIFSTDATGGTETIKAGIYTKHILMKGTTGATVTWVDSWKGKTNQLSFGGSYAYSVHTNDTAVIHFKGQSFKWFATIPTGKTGATVKIEYRKKKKNIERVPHPLGGRGNVVAANAWYAWQTLEASYKLPENIYAEKVYEITYESGILERNTVYEIKITNLDGNYCSIDSIEGYWVGSFTMYNEDNTRISLSSEDMVTQLYDKRFSGGSMYKWNKSGAGASLMFEGDRAIVVSAKGRNHGNLRIALYLCKNKYGEIDPGLENHVMIPGGDEEDGSIIISLERSKRANESPQHVVFDTNDYFPSGLTWSNYILSITYYPKETYTATRNEINSDNFVYRCKACDPDTSGKYTINKYVYLDAIGVHEAAGLSLKFDNVTHMEQLSSVAEALQTEWNINESGVSLTPRIGVDTDVVLREGTNTLVDYEMVNDVSKVASMLFSSGSDIDGLPLFTITEDKKAREILGRTVMRQEDFREIGDYQQLVGISRGALRKRRVPEKRITVTHIGNLSLNKGDTFYLWTQKMGQIKVRISRKQRTQSTAGTVYQLECMIWPLTD